MWNISFLIVNYIIEQNPKINMTSWTFVASSATKDRYVNKWKMKPSSRRRQHRHQFRVYNDERRRMLDRDDIESSFDTLYISKSFKK